MSNSSIVDLSKRVEEFEEKADIIHKLMTQLNSQDPEETEAAMKELDVHLEEKRRERDENMLEGCRIVKSNKNTINIRESQMDKRKRLSEEFRQLGNECFRGNEFEKALEYYTSAILQWDQNPKLYNNRAQTELKLRNSTDAIEDCKKAMKLDPNLLKSYIIMTRALRFDQQFNKALGILAVAETELGSNINASDMKFIHNLRQEITNERDDLEKRMTQISPIQ